MVAAAAPAIVLCALVFALPAAAASLPGTVEAGQRDAALELIASGADVNERAADGTTALHWAVHRGDLDLVLDTCARTLILDAGKLAAGGPTEAILAGAELMEKHGLEVPYRLRK